MPLEVCRVAGTAVGKVADMAAGMEVGMRLFPDTAFGSGRTTVEFSEAGSWLGYHPRQHAGSDAVELVGAWCWPGHRPARLFVRVS